MTMEMESQQQENEDEINDDYRPTTNGNDTANPNENNSENDDNNGMKAATLNGSASTSGAPSARLQSNI